MTLLTENLRDFPIRLFLAATGAGAGVQQHLWEIPGCSSFFEGACFPYSREESLSFTGLVDPPENLRYASEAYAIDMAMAAFRRAIGSDSKREPVGLAVTASVTSLTPHRGEHRAHSACMTRTRVALRTIVLTKMDTLPPEEVRKLDGSVVDLSVLEVLLTCFDLMPPPQGLKQGELVNEVVRRRFFENPVFYPGGKRGPLRKIWAERPPVLFPGAFNPPHEGHKNLAQSPQARIHGEVVYEICSTPPHKPAMTVQEMILRAENLKNETVLFTEGDPLYIDKARRFPGAGLIIGADALIRMLDPKWGPKPKALLEEFNVLGTKFLVAGRLVGDRFVSSVEAIQQIPEEYQHFFRPLTGRWDMSSSSIRALETQNA